MAGDDFHAYLVPPNVRVGDVVTYLGPTTPLGAAWHAPSDPTRPSAAREHDQEQPMTSPTQRRHDEILGRLDALIDAVQSTTARDSLHRLLAEESAAERRGEPVDVTEEPPVGSQVTDKDGDVWERLEEGWACVAEGGDPVDPPDYCYASWRAPRICAPLRPTTDADRERVGLSDPHSTVTEPSVTVPADVDPDEAPSVDYRVGFANGQRSVLPRAEKAEAAMRDEVTEHDKSRAAVLRLTRERDRLRWEVEQHSEGARKAVNALGEWKARHESLREDVATRLDECATHDGEGCAPVVQRLGSILARDAKRGQS